MPTIPALFLLLLLVHTCQFPFIMSFSPVINIAPATDPSPFVTLLIGDKSFRVEELNEFSFKVILPGPNSYDIHEGTFEGALQCPGNDPLNIQFRPRGSEGSDKVTCSFIDLSLADRKKLMSYLSYSEGQSRKGDELEQLSYDEIAGAKSSAKKAPKANKPPGSGRLTKIVSTLGAMLVVLMIATVVIIGIVKSKGSVPLANSTLVGNYLAVDSIANGVVSGMEIAPGKEVEAGELLFYIEAQDDVRLAQERVYELSELEAQIRLYKSHIKQAESDLSDAALSMAVEYDSVQGLVTQAMQAVKVSQAHEDKLRQLMLEKVIGDPLVVEAEVKTSQARLQLETYRNEKRRLHEKLIAAQNGRFTSSESQAAQRRNNLLELGLATARRDALLTRQSEFESKIPIYAPISGRVSTVYQGSGSYVKAGDSVVALTRSDHNWAVGHVLAKEAPKVKPGQEVTVRVPSMNKNLQRLRERDRSPLGLFAGRVVL